MQQAAKYAYLAYFGGSLYVTFEVFWRGRSHWTMFVLAAILFVLIGLLNEIWTSWRLFPQAVAGAIIATAALVIHLAGLESFGVPYLTPFAVSAGKEAREHVFLRRPLPQIKDRPPALHPLNRRKQR